ncbi:DNA/pantothenate metabolism flavoprotein [Fimicolochytrium jonesii]|uniref:DNA/pantothenate metabolism flavoprotein n=1 Tax=Fimicolochytrium jonesii TaxID=1396493 RepID=UPI0022FDEA68|nr:DNA/pantothenate metabolism flavoprotein [Fimicolochytrium jonesii]KAI8827238.1 DNA/pantothenate metabolism flavoprotein [Fimicolochytrium jonesii]
MTAASTTLLATTGGDDPNERLAKRLATKHGIQIFISMDIPPPSASSVMGGDEVEATQQLVEQRIAALVRDLIASPKLAHFSDTTAPSEANPSPPGPGAAPSDGQSQQNTAPSRDTNGSSSSSPHEPSSTGTTPPSSSASKDWESFFRETPPPAGIEEAGQRVDAFVALHAAANRRVVLVTSGGTTVPLERNTVRFIDNFSAGTRGATSAEYFIEAGYAVIFMHRQFSLQPYSRHYSHTTNCFLDYMKVLPDGSLTVESKYTDHMRTVLSDYNHAKQDHLLIMEPFVTVEDYLFLLRRFTTSMSRHLRHNAMYYLAAAVSDFFVPAGKLAEHKIQSSGGELNLKLDQVPKIIFPLVDRWAEKGFIISFKLETDPSILDSKSRRALATYHHQLVIGNILATRKKTVSIVSANARQSQTPASTSSAEQQLETTTTEITLTQAELDAHVEIESRIVPLVVQRHGEWIDEQTRSHARLRVQTHQTLRIAGVSFEGWRMHRLVKAHSFATP